MKSKKMLIISYFPSHPHYAGDRKRTYNLLSNLKKMGYEIHFVYENKEFFSKIFQKPDINEMRKEWTKVYVIPLTIYELKRYIDRQIGRLGIFLRKFVLGLFNIMKKTELKVRKPPTIDNLYNPYLGEFIKKLSEKIDFDLVISNGVFLSKALENFNEKTIRVIDTIDALTTEEAYKTAKYESRPIFRNQEEARALNRADVIIAIQDEEAKFFKSLVDKDKKVVTIGHVANLKKPIKRNSNRKNIFFIGYPNPANIKGVNFIIKEVFPEIKLRFLDAQFVVVGKICNLIEGGVGIVKMGEVEDLDKAYSMADIVVSPLFIGTGLKIKNIESLAYCMPLITTSLGARGLNEGAKKPFLLADNSKEFIEAIDVLFSDINLYNRLSGNAYNFIKNYNKKNLKALKEILNGEENE